MHIWMYKRARGHVQVHIGDAYWHIGSVGHTEVHKEHIGVHEAMEGVHRGIYRVFMQKGHTSKGHIRACRGLSTIRVMPHEDM